MFAFMPEAAYYYSYYQGQMLFGAAGAELGHFADVPGFAVDVHEQRLKLGREVHVIVRAAEPALFAELQERDAANRARPLVEPGQFFGGLSDRQVLSQQTCHRWQHFTCIIRRRR